MRSARWVFGWGLALALAAACGGQSRGPDRDRLAGEDDAAAGADGERAEPDSAPNSSSGSNAALPSGDEREPGTLPPASAGTAGFIIPAVPPAPTPAPLPPREPGRHRATPDECDRVRASGGTRPPQGEPPIACTRDEDCPRPLDCTGCLAACVDFGAGLRCVSAYGECLLDADCTGGENARCSSSDSGGYCSADQCFDDAGCPSGGPCGCEGAPLEAGNTCLPGNCKTDADCGPGGYCSPSPRPCLAIGGVAGYYCHTPQDTCIDNSDCAAPYPTAACFYDGRAGRWACAEDECLLP